MNFELTGDQKELQKMARDFSQGELAPKALEWDEKKIFPKDVLKQAGELGFLSIYTPEEFGGIGLGRLDAAIIFEELAGGCTSTAAFMTIHNMVNWMIATWGKPELAQKYCPELGAGNLLGSYCLTEPGSGSDAGALKTTAVLKGDKYIVNGTKAFVSGGGETDVLVVMVRTGEDGPKGISTLLIPADLSGIEYGKNEEKMGWNSQPTRIINFVNVEVPADNLMGSLGEGFKIAMKGLDGGRINIATCSIGAAQKCLTLAQKYMHEREAFGKTLAKFQALQFKLAEMATGLVASRQMVRLAAHKLDMGDPNTITYCAMAKKFATDEGFKICNDAIQIFGGYGYTKEYQVERFMRDTRVHQILEGTNEIMNLIIARKILQEGATEEIR
ncbi:MAG: acyl-CoA dehydrogenase [Deltaproteobacteria bacterium]|nr:MAG: acyl-CoA dehydrogenase [Deltaproteobacteria bacterium]